MTRATQAKLLSPPLRNTDRLVVRVERAVDGVHATLIAGSDPVSHGGAEFGRDQLAALGDAIRQVESGLADHWVFGGGRDEGGTVEVSSARFGVLPGLVRIGIYPLAQSTVIMVVDSRLHYLEEFGASVIASEWARMHAEYGLFSVVIEAATNRVIYVSPQVEAFTGLSAGEVLADSEVWTRAVIPEDQSLIEPFRLELRSRGIASVDLRMRDSGGVVRVMRHRFTIVLDAVPPLIVGVVRDVTELVAINDQTRTLLRGIEQSREGFIVTNALGRIAYINRAATVMSRTGEMLNLLGRPWEALFDAPSIANIKKQALPSLAEAGSWAGSVTVRLANGKDLHLSMILSSKADGSVVWSSRDCTEETLIRARLAESQRLFQNVVEHLPLGLLIKDLDGRYAYANPQARAYIISDARPSGAPDDHGCGQSEPRIIGETDHELLPRELADRVRKSDRAVIVTKTTLVEDYVGTVTEPTRVFNAVRFPVLDETGAVWRLGILLSDVSEKRQLERHTKDLLERREKLLTMQREFVSLVSHEFRTPMAAIRGTLYLLRKKLNPAEGELVARYLDLQTDALDTLKELVDQVLLLNRIEHATGEAKLVETDLMELLRFVRLQFNDSTPTPRIRLEGPEGGRCPLRLDESLIRAAVDNLVSNALKYSPSDAEVLISLAPTQSGWRISVKDVGRGVPEPEQARLFQPFFRASNVGTTSGTGLGLTIVKRAAELHGGSAGFMSIVGEGSTFFIDLPGTVAGAADSEC